MKTLPISVCLIAGAEARRIGKALDSVVSWTSEIIVVINENVADGTDTIAEAHGAKVFREPWKGFVAQKNSALDKATQPWVLGLDADEAVSPELQQEIMEFFKRNDLPAACSFPRCSSYFGRWIRHGDWYPDRSVRLWKRGSARWAGIDPHDRLKVEGRIVRLRHDLYHFTSESYSQQVAKTLAYADIFARHCQDSGRRVTFGDLAFRPFWRFLRSYFFRRGFLDGWQGLSIAWMAAFYTFLRYARAREDSLLTKPRS